MFEMKTILLNQLGLVNIVALFFLVARYGYYGWFVSLFLMLLLLILYYFEREYIMIAAFVILFTGFSLLLLSNGMDVRKL